MDYSKAILENTLEEEKLGIRNILGEYHREGVAVQLLTEVVGGWLKFT